MLCRVRHNTSNSQLAAPQPQKYQVPGTEIWIHVLGFYNEVNFLDSQKFLNATLTSCYQVYDQHGPSIRIDNEFMYEGDDLFLLGEERKPLPRGNPGLTYSTLCSTISGLASFSIQKLRGRFFELTSEVWFKPEEGAAVQVGEVSIMMM